MRLLLAGALLLPSFGCMSSTEPTRLETSLAAIERQVDALRSDAPTRGDLNVVLETLEDLLESGVSSRADLKEDLREIIVEIEALRTSTQEQRRTLAASLQRIRRLNDELDLLKAQLERQESYLAGMSELLETSRQTPPDPSVEPKSLYDDAYQQYLNGDYVQAAAGFEHYLETFPGGEDRDSAQYWLGESYMGQGRFRIAIDELERVAERYPNSDKVASSMLRIGVAYIELGERDRANEMLLRVRQEYPDSDEAILALQQLDNPANEL